MSVISCGNTNYSSIYTHFGHILYIIHMWWFYICPRTIFQWEFNGGVSFYTRLTNFGNFWFTTCAYDLYIIFQCGFNGYSDYVIMRVSVNTPHDMGIIWPWFSFCIQPEWLFCHWRPYYYNIWYGHHWNTFLIVHAIRIVTKALIYCMIGLI